jgi:hypothetical protein
LFLRAGGPAEVLFWSPMYQETQRKNCSLEVWLFMSNMSRSTLRLVSNSTMLLIVREVRGNSHDRWEKFSFKIGPFYQKFSLILEVVTKDDDPAIMALDNLRLVECFNGDQLNNSFGTLSLIRKNVIIHSAQSRPRSLPRHVIHYSAL